MRYQFNVTVLSLIRPNFGTGGFGVMIVYCSAAVTASRTSETSKWSMKAPPVSTDCLPVAVDGRTDGPEQVKAECEGVTSSALGRSNGPEACGGAQRPPLFSLQA